MFSASVILNDIKYYLFYLSPMLILSKAFWDLFVYEVFWVSDFSKMFFVGLQGKIP